MPNCNAHCRSCGRHFSGTTAFDRHRDGPWDDRFCKEPEDVKRLHSYEGDCDVASPDNPVSGVEVWSTKGPE